MSEQQTYATHRRFDPPYHFFLAPLSLVAVIAALTYLVRRPSVHHVLVLVAAVAFVLVVVKFRSYALRAQDRLIRLEETLRMERILPDDLKGRIAELTPKQMVGLRFAADAELAHRVREALDEHLDGDAIKKRIQVWRPDTFRV
jgi:hypothetical protein